MVGDGTRMHHLSLLPHDGLNIFEKLLLWSNHHPWPTYSHPGNDFGCRQSIMLHEVGPDTSPRSPQSRLAMHRECLVLWDLFKGPNHRLQNVHGRTRSINIKLMQMLNPRSNEILFLVHFLVEPYHQRHSSLLKIRNIVGR